MRDFELEKLNGVYIPFWLYDIYYGDTSMIVAERQNMNAAHLNELLYLRIYTQGGTMTVVTRGVDEAHAESIRDDLLDVLMSRKDVFSNFGDFNIEVYGKGTQTVVEPELKTLQETSVDSLTRMQTSLRTSQNQLSQLVKPASVPQYSKKYMLKNGIKGNEAKQKAAEAFINFNSRPDNVVRNMYYIGYTSVISGGGDPTIFEYADYNYSAEEGEETEEYDLSYFFAEEGEETDEYVIEASPDMLERQLYAAYPPDDVMRRSSIMTCFDEEQTKAINQMWINVRCYNITKMPFWGWICAAVVLAGTVYLAVRRFR